MLDLHVTYLKEPIRESWDDFFVSLCNLWSTRSKDKSTKIGCVIVSGLDNRTVVSQGYNCYPRGINDNLCYRQDRKFKYNYFSHAEANALSNALRNNTPVYDATLYLNKWLPCSDCARLIIQSGIHEIVTPYVDIPDRWLDNTAHSLLMLTECRIPIRKPNRKCDLTHDLLLHCHGKVQDGELKEILTSYIYG